MSDAAQIHDDHCLPFQVEGVDVKGQIVRLSAAVDEILSRHAYPEPVTLATGELLTIVVMLGTSLKFDGKLSLQIRGEGPISTLVADFFTPGNIRAYAQFDEAAIAALVANPDSRGSDGYWSTSDLFGSGHLAVVIDQGPETERYQGFVPLEGARISELAETYFKQSEQVATSFKVGMAQVMTPRDGGEVIKNWRSGGIMLQHLPKPGEGKIEAADPAENWSHVNILLDTATDHEILDPSLSSQELLYRLYHEDGVRVFDSHDIKAGCQCSETRVRTVLKGFSPEEFDDMLEDGQVKVTCEFCNAGYDFLPSEIFEV